MSVLTSDDWTLFQSLAVASLSLERNIQAYRRFCNEWAMPFIDCQKMVSTVGAVQTGCYVIESLILVGYPEGYVDLLDRVVEYEQRPLVAEWLEQLAPVVVVDLDDPRSSQMERFEFMHADLLPIGLYGLVDLSGYKASYFSFAKINAPFSIERVTAKLKLLVPVLHRLFAELSELGAVSLPRLDRIDKLTPAERDVFTYLLRGYSNKDIAILLQRSPLTVKNQAHAIFSKLCVNSRGELLNAYANARLRGRE